MQLVHIPMKNNLNLVTRFLSSKTRHWLLIAPAAAMLTACGLTGGNAPIESRGYGVPAAAPIRRVDPATLPGYAFMGKPGYYTVRQGDTIRSISRALNVDWNALARWNSNWIPNPNMIEVGQVLRVVPPVGGTASSAVDGSAAAVAAAVNQPTTPTATPKPAPKPTTSKPVASIGKKLAWPTRGGAVIKNFSPSNNSFGIDIAGKQGDPILASSGGRVIYSGSGLRSYGNLIIVKHSDSLLTVYAHNNKLLVKEGDTVKQGQQIATMGNSEANRVKLHFEVRKGRQTVNPLSYLPKR